MIFCLLAERFRPAAPGHLKAHTPLPKCFGLRPTKGLSDRPLETFGAHFVGHSCQMPGQKSYFSLVLSPTPYNRDAAKGSRGRPQSHLVGRRPKRSRKAETFPLFTSSPFCNILFPEQDHAQAFPQKMTAFPQKTRPKVDKPLQFVKVFHTIHRFIHRGCGSITAPPADRSR